MDRDRKARQKEIQRQGTYLAMATPVALIVLLGTFRGMLPASLMQWIPGPLGERREVAAAPAE